MHRCFCAKPVVGGMYSSESFLCLRQTPPLRVIQYWTQSRQSATCWQCLRWKHLPVVSTSWRSDQYYGYFFLTLFRRLNCLGNNKPPPRSTRLCILAKSSTSFVWGKDRKVPAPGWQVLLDRAVLSVPFLCLSHIHCVPVSYTHLTLPTILRV